MDRRLAAVLAADFADYSTHVGRDELGTVRAVRGHMDALELVIGMHNGRVVKTMGDGLLVEYSSVVHAVSCAVAMQDRLAERNNSVPAERQLQLRIGVHVGDILTADGDIFGDGVNVASRVEGMAPVGGVVVTSRVHDDVAGKLEFEFNSLGEHSLKNIARPLELFAVDRANPVVKVQTPPQTLPDKPSLVVLPLVNQSSNAENEYLADGLTEDIINALTYVPWLFVIARNSSFVYKGAVVDVRQIGRELGVRYVFDGSVRHQGNRIRVTGRLVDAETGAQIWAGRFDGVDDDIFELQDEVTEALAAQIAPNVQIAEMARSKRSHPTNLDAYDHYLRALAALNRAQPVEAGKHLDRAIEIAPDYAKALAIRAWCGTLYGSWATGVYKDRNQAEGIALAQRALALDSVDLEVAAYAGYTLAYFGEDIDRAMALVQDATEKCPSFAWAWTSRALVEDLHGDLDRGLEYALKAQRLSPKDPQMFRMYVPLCSSLRRLGRLEEALDAATNGLRLNPNIVILQTTKIVCLSQLGHLGQAREQARDLLSRSPDFTVSNYMQHFENFRQKASYDDMRPALLEAGLPD